MLSVHVRVLVGALLVVACGAEARDDEPTGQRSPEPEAPTPSEPSKPESEPEPEPEAAQSADAPEPDATPTEDDADDPVTDDLVLFDTTLTNEPPPPSCLEDLPATLPGCDPADPATWGLDCDGDGIPGYIADVCVLSQAQRPSALIDVDCDDTDPTLQVLVQRDPDADGVGSGVDVFCSGQDVPPGYALLIAEGDCDENDPLRHGGAEEVWGDGADFDCDGEDAPGCIAIVEGRAITPLAPQSETCQDASDVRLVDFVDCWNCCGGIGGLMGVLGNGGGETFRGRAVVSYTVTDEASESGELLSIEELAPGDAVLFEMPRVVGTLVIALSLFDTDGEALNNCSGEGLEESFAHVRCPCAR